VEGEPETDAPTAADATAAGVALRQIVDILEILIAAGPPGTAALHDVLDRGADAVAAVFEGTFSSPDEALRFLPQLVAGLGGSGPLAPPDRATPCASWSDAVAQATGDASLGAYVNPLGDPVAAALHAAGVHAEDFDRAFTAALEDGLGETLAAGPEGASVVPELLAMAAAAAHVIPGGAAAVNRYLSRRRHDPHTRRWGARVGALLRELRRSPQPLRLSAPRRGIARRARRRPSHHRVRTQSRAGPHDGPEPGEPPAPGTHGRVQRGAP
jgi:hypothetical protein